MDFKQYLIAYLLGQLEKIKTGKPLIRHEHASSARFLTQDSINHIKKDPIGWVNSRAHKAKEITLFGREQISPHDQERLKAARHVETTRPPRVTSDFISKKNNAWLNNKAEHVKNAMEHMERYRQAKSPQLTLNVQPARKVAPGMADKHDTTRSPVGPRQSPHIDRTTTLWGKVTNWLRGDGARKADYRHKTAQDPYSGIPASDSAPFPTRFSYSHDLPVDYYVCDHYRTGHYRNTKNGLVWVRGHPVSSHKKTR
ncbi:MAG: hypothetical protein ACQEXC_09625 [Pseudomonadota bacterium]